MKKKVKITGTFTGQVNNDVTLKVFRPYGAPQPFEFEKTYSASFVEELELEPGLIYHIQLTGTSASGFDVLIAGEFDPPNPISDNFKAGAFAPGYSIKTES